MNVLYLTRNYEYVQPQIADALNKKNGISCYVLFYQFSFRNEHSKFAQYVFHYSCPYFFSLYLSSVVAFLYVSCKCLKICKEKKIDVINANMSYFDGHIAMLCSKLLGIKYVVTYRGTDEDYSHFWNSLLLKKSSEIIFRNAVSVIFLNRHYRDRFLAQLSENEQADIKSKSTIIPNGIDSYYLDNKSCHKRGDILTLIFIGKLCKNKNLETVVEATKKISSCYAVKLLVVGEMADSEYEKIINENNFISYFNYCDKTEIVNLLRKSDILVVPSHHESFGLVYPEAMSQGIPVIYTRDQGFDGFFKDGEVGYAVSDTDSSEIAEKIKMILKDYDRISKNCNKYASLFSWDCIIEEYIKQYRKSKS